MVAVVGGYHTTRDTSSSGGICVRAVRYVACCRCANEMAGVFYAGEVVEENQRYEKMEDLRNVARGRAALGSAVECCVRAGEC